MDEGTTGVVSTRVVVGPGTILKLTANSAPIKLCGRLVR